MRTRATLLCAVLVCAAHTAYAQAQPPPAVIVSMAEGRQTMRARAKVLADFGGQVIPEATPELLASAEAIVRGAEAQFGKGLRAEGKGLDWSGATPNPTGVPADLLEFRLLRTLASAYRTTHDARFALAARAYLEDWIRTEPDYAQGCRPGDNTLAVSRRLGTSVESGWGASLPVFLDSPAFDDAFLSRVFADIATQARFLSRTLTVSGNWRISELDALVFTALRMPFLSAAPELLETGLKGMRCALATQFLPDGVHEERTPRYHAWMAQVAANYVLLAQRFPELDARVDPELVARALDYDVQSAGSGFNDSSVVLRDPQDRGREQSRVSRLRQLFPNREVSPYPPLDQVFASAGQVFSRTAWEPGAAQVAFDAASWGGGHNHLSRLSLVFRAGGRLLVADPGAFSYDFSDPLALAGRQTPAHSTLNLNGGNQSEADAQLLRTEFTPETALLHARYQGGYWSGKWGWWFWEGHGKADFGIHDRVVFWVKGEYLLVLDGMRAEANVPVHNVWQLGPTEKWEMDRGNLAWWSQNQDENLYLQLVPFGKPAEMNCWEGSRAPLRGWVANGAKPAPLVEFRYPCANPYGEVTMAHTAALLVPFAGLVRPAYAVRDAHATNYGNSFEIDLARPDGGHDLVAWSNRLSVALEGLPSSLTTDAPFVWLRFDAQGPAVKGFVLDGSFVEYQGRRLWEAGRRETGLVSVER